MNLTSNPSSLLSTYTSNKWQRIGTAKRSGVALPLFSVYSKNSIGCGEFPDLKLLVDWCCITGMSIIQLLPVNELGNDFAPYNAISTFAVEPAYISIKNLKKVDLKPFRNEIKELKKIFPAGGSSVNYDVKESKIRLLKKIFLSADSENARNFKKYRNENFHWLKYYCLFKILTEINGNKSWKEWDLKYKYIAPYTAEKLLKTHEQDVNFLCWMQWQLYEQLISVKRYARKKNVFIMGDIPFLAAENSADVWAYKNYFKLQLSSGAPPDMYFSKGQRWGMPPYNWENITADNFGYIKQKLKYAENFYDMYRIDHFVGLFRLWTIDLKTPEEEAGLSGEFDPHEESLWEEHGKQILKVMVESSEMLPCAEDLGTVPECSDKVLKEFGITGINVQRWQKTPGEHVNFIKPEFYRINSVATVSTHDSSSFPSWWENEAGTVDEFLFDRTCKKYNLPENKLSELKNLLFDESLSAKGRLYWRDNIYNKEILLHRLGLNYDSGKEFIDLYETVFNEKKTFWKQSGLHEGFSHKASSELIKTNLKNISNASSIFSIQLLMEYLYLDSYILDNYKGSDFRINFPGTVNKLNWSMVIPVSLEELPEMKINNTLKEINFKSGRI